MTYYRIALQADQSTIWEWESRAAVALDMLFRVLKLYRTMPWDRIRVFCASSIEGLDEMLARENIGDRDTPYEFVFPTALPQVLA